MNKPSREQMALCRGFQEGELADACEDKTTALAAYAVDETKGSYKDCAAAFKAAFILGFYNLDSDVPASECSLVYDAWNQYGVRIERLGIRLQNRRSKTRSYYV